MVRIEISVLQEILTLQNLMSLLQNFQLNQCLEVKRFTNLNQKHFGNDDKTIYFYMIEWF